MTPLDRLAGQEAPSDARRVLAAIAWLEKRLAEPVRLGDAAREAGLSPFHFHRVFRRVAGETLQARVRRLRVEQAASLLRNTTLSVTQIALRCGYDSHAGLTRRFTATYGVSPTAWRAQAQRLPFHRPDDPGGAALAPISVMLQRFPAWRVAFMRHQGDYWGALPLWERLRAWSLAQGLLREDAVLLGINHDDWAATPVDRHRYDAAIALPAGLDPPGPVAVTAIEGGWAATTHYRGTVLGLMRLWDQFVGPWLAGSGLRVRGGVGFDLYPARQLLSSSWLHRVATAALDIEATLCIPVEEPARSRRGG